MTASPATVVQTKEKATKFHLPASEDFLWTIQVNASAAYKKEKGMGKKKGGWHSIKINVAGAFLILGRVLLG